MDNNNTIETNMILTDDKEVVIDIEMSKLIYEYITASEARKEAVWINKFITEFGVVPSISDALECWDRRHQK